MADKECNWNALLKQIQTLLGTWKTLLQEEGTRLNTAQKTLRNLQDALGQVEERKKSGKTAVEECGQKLTEAAASAKSAEALLKQLNDSEELLRSEALLKQLNGKLQKLFPRKLKRKKKRLLKSWLTVPA